MEKILRIEEISGQYGCMTQEGYAIVTDKQTIKLLIDNHQDCCEDWGYFMSEDNFESFIGAKILEITLTDTALNTKKIDEHIEYGVDNGDIMFVNIVTDKGVLQFVAYNCHNGYYGHGAYVFSEQLKHETCL